MGFFTDLKDDLSQAVNELMPETEGSNDAKEAAGLGKTGQNGAQTLLDSTDFIESPETPGTEPEGYYQPEGNTQDKRMSDEVAVITAGMTINGDITSEGSLDLIGTVVGNIDLLGRLNVTGSVQGDSRAAEIYAEGARITGEINSRGSIKIGHSSVVIGNIFAAGAVIAGAVKGDIDVQGPLVLDSTAIVMGNIKSKSVQINNGAVIEGMCSQCYADVNAAAFFEDYKKGKK